MNRAGLDFIRAGDGLVDLEAKPRMLAGIFIGQYCITAITWFFMPWFPIYLVKDRGFDILQAGFVAMVPALFGLLGGVSSGFVSDHLLRGGRSLSFARKIAITIGLLMSAAFFGKGFGSLGWAIVADTAPREMIGMTGGMFNAIGNCAGIVTPVVIGYLLQSSGSFSSALVFVGAHGLVAVLSYWIIVGRTERLKLRV